MSGHTSILVLNQSNAGTSKNNTLTLNLPMPIEMKNQEVFLQTLFLYYSWVNISASYGNNTCQYIFNGTTRSITFPDGFYRVEDIIGYIQLRMVSFGDYLLDANGNYVYYISLTTNPVYYGVTLTCTPIPSALPAGYTNPAGITLSGNCPLLVINNAAFGKLIGFATGTYPAVTQTTTYQVNSTLIPNISPVQTVLINSNLVNNSRVQSGYPQTIGIISPNVSYGALINYEPQQPLCFPVQDGIYNQITVFFTDQANNLLANLDNNIVVTLVIRDRGAHR